jgi:hypothetical protein
MSNGGYQSLYDLFLTYFILLDSRGLDTFFLPSSGNITPVRVHLAPLFNIIFPERIGIYYYLTII